MTQTLRRCCWPPSGKASAEEKEVRGLEENSKVVSWQYDLSRRGYQNAGNCQLGIHSKTWRAPLLVVGTVVPGVGVVSVDPTAPPYGLFVTGTPPAVCGAAGATAALPGAATIAADRPVKAGGMPP